MPRSRVVLAAGVLVLTVLGGPAGHPGGAGGGGPEPDAAPAVHVSGNELADAAGRRVVLHGINRSGGEYACVDGTGLWDGPMGQASLTAMRTWHINAVRVPLNEACWNGESYVTARYQGAPYRRAVQAYVRLLNRNGMVAILDLHLTEGGYAGPSAECASARAVCLKPMPDATGSVRFWSSVARTFKHDGAVIFDLFNEPYPERARGGSPAEAWRCWLRGGACAGISYPVAGMQALVDAVRSADAGNVIMVGGLAYAADLSGWLRHEPADPRHNLAASWHSYASGPCSSRPCWAAQVAPVIAKVPVVTAEIGQQHCTATYIGPLMRWLDARSTGYLAWAWNTDFGCSSGPGLITSYAGTPTRYGRGYCAHLRSLGQGASHAIKTALGKQPQPRTVPCPGPPGAAEMLRLIPPREPGLAG